ncbi:hypothetical protein LWC35_12555 [Pseudonocardia kujensis]|uniref:hypothetical protein n=1 Tax=Pseudonocardia kujensis TaxID=1128675 RepID=UPI001E2B9C42|nr:hypothetical protein [Pseudonocardia kujensis]MCE0763731.1 hypothetical protein [Pseudonocardia kujensis]
MTVRGSGVGLRLVRAWARLVGALVVGGLTASVAVAWVGAEIARAVRGERRRSGAGRRPGCVWCGYRHTRHPVRVHADDLAARVSERVAA